MQEQLSQSVLQADTCGTGIHEEFSQITLFYPEIVYLGFFDLLQLKSCPAWAQGQWIKVLSKHGFGDI